MIPREDLLSQDLVGWARRTIERKVQRDSEATMRIKDPMQVLGPEADPLAELGDLVDLIRQHAQDLDQIASETGPLTKAEPEPEVRADIAIKVAALSDELQDGIRERIAPLSYEAVEEFAEALMDEGTIPEMGRMAALLYWAAKIV